MASYPPFTRQVRAELWPAGFLPIGQNGQGGPFADVSGACEFRDGNASPSSADVFWNADSDNAFVFVGRHFKACHMAVPTGGPLALFQFVREAGRCVFRSGRIIAGDGLSDGGAHRRFLLRGFDGEEII